MDSEIILYLQGEYPLCYVYSVVLDVYPLSDPSLIHPHQELDIPRLIRGQVHRCVGNYDRTRDTLTCMSVRAALHSEQRNAQESVKASDAEMRGLVKSLSEV